MPQTLPCLWLLIFLGGNFLLLLMKIMWSSFFFILPSSVRLNKDLGVGKSFWV